MNTGGMCIRSRAVSIAWKVVMLVAGAWGLLDGSGLLRGAFDPNFWHMFTNLSNLLAWGYFLAATIWLARGRGAGGVPFAAQVKYTAMLSLLVTMLISHFMLADALFQDGRLVWHLVVMHYVCPIMCLLDWLIFDEKGKMPLWGPVSWLSFVLAYLVLILVGVGVLGLFLGGGTTADVTPYPYTFLDPALSGAGGVAAFCGMMLAAFLVLGYLILALDRLLARIGRR